MTADTIIDGTDPSHAQTTLNQLYYVYSSELNVPLEVKIVALDGRLPKLDYRLLSDDLSMQQCACVQQSRDSRLTNQDEDVNMPDLYVTCAVWSDGRQTGDTIRTAYKCHEGSSRFAWNQWLRLPIRFAQLSLDAVLVFTLWDVHQDGNKPHAIGSTSLPLFSKRAVLRKGIYDLRMWPFVEGDGAHPEKTPGKWNSTSTSDTCNNADSNNQSEMCRLSKASKHHRAGLMPAVDWLDRMAFREIEQINEREKRETRHLYLVVEMPYIHHKQQQQLVVYFEKYSDHIHHFARQPKQIQFYDHELGLENLVEAKHRILTRGARATSVDKKLKPNAVTREQLESMLNIPSIILLSPEQRDLIWKFRYHLSSNPRALPKFLQSVQWDRQDEVKEAIDLLNQWAPVAVEDALQLLTSEFTHAQVRRYAVSRLSKAPTAQLLLYLLQLVQALKYENLLVIESGSDTSFVRSFMAADTNTGDLWQTADCAQDATLLDIKPELTDSPSAIKAGEGPNSPKEISPEPIVPSKAPVPTHKQSIDSCESEMSKNDTNNMDLATFLIQAACADATLANYFYWYLKVECEAYTVDLTSTTEYSPPINTTNTNSTTSDDLTTRRQQIHQMYHAVLKRLSKALMKGGSEAKRRRAQLIQQVNFVDRMLQVMHSVAKESGNRKRKIEHLQSQLTQACVNPSHANQSVSQQQPTLIGRALHNNEVAVPGADWSQLNGMPLPLDPSVRVNQVLADRATLFNSALMPCKLTFQTVSGRDYVTIFKHGDDLRQDQLVVQMIELMDGLLRADNLDLRLTPYKVLATGVQHGFVQFVDSQPLRDVLQEFGTITQFFRFYRPSNTGPYGIEADVIDNYVRSLAGYSVISYVLGIGDRHLHNLLLCKNGRLFHVDFGYILGRDPKPLPPPMKLTEAMIEPIGGQQSAHWQQCKRYCYDSFLIIRRHANLILNLFALMHNASIPDIAIEPDRAAAKVEERLQLNLSDEEAVTLMQNVIDASLSAKMAVFVDLVHDLAQAFRN